MLSAPYIPITKKDQKEMLDSIGVARIEELLRSIPKQVRFPRDLDIQGPTSEFEIQKILNQIVKYKSSNLRTASFLGGGIYDHITPSICNHLTLRGEFLTAYTPYQPEVSQGTLQVLFEFQTMIAGLFGMDISNASHYDGATSLADGVLMASRVLKNLKHIVFTSHVHPDYVATVKTYTNNFSLDYHFISENKISGSTDLDALEKLLSKLNHQETIVISQSPNYLGVVENLKHLSQSIKSKNIFWLVNVAEPLSLTVFNPPGHYQADVVTGEGQSFGIPPSFGGPLLGLFTTKENYLRQMPGRVCGKTVDKLGRESFTLTLSTREQHIRRQKATSNICTNQNLCVVFASIYIATLGRHGLHHLALDNMNRSQLLQDKLKTFQKIKLAYTNPTFNEFTLELKTSAEEFCQKMWEKFSIIPGIPLQHLGASFENKLLVCVTETKDKQAIENWIHGAQQILG